MDEGESLIFEEAARLHLETALQGLVRSCQHNQMRRPLLTKVFRLVMMLDDGHYRLFEVPAESRLWVEGLRYASVYPAEGAIDNLTTFNAAHFVPALNVLPLSWDAERTLQQVRPQSLVMGTYSYQEGLIYVAPAANSTVDHLVVIGLYVPDFSDEFPMPVELETQGVQILANLLRSQTAKPATA